MANLQVGVAGNGTVTVGAGASVHSPANNALTLGTNNSERLRIDASGRLLLGTTTEGHAEGDDLTVATSSITGITVRSGTSSPGNIFFSDGTSGNAERMGIIRYDHNGDYMMFGVNYGEKLRIDSSGRVIIGHNASITTYGVTSRLQVAGDDYATSGIGIRRDSADAGGGAIIFGKSRGSQGGVTVVQSGDSLGEFVFCGADGTDVTSYAGTINCSVDGTPGSNDMPGRLTFSTASDGAAGVTERVRIDKNGQLVLSNGSMSTAYGNSICGGTNLELDTSGVIKFRTDTNQKMSVTDNGLCFGSDSASANALDDYEEGTWSGTIVTGGGNVGNAWYTKIGNTVFVTGNCTSWGDTTSGTAITISGFPFTCAATSYGLARFCKHSDSHKGPWIEISSTTGTFLKSSTSTGSCDYMYHSGIVQGSGSAIFAVWYNVS